MPSSKTSSSSGGHKSGTTAARQAHLNNHANQCNPKHPEYRGFQPGYQGKGTKADLINHAKQLNPTNSLYKGEQN
ncbi:unnamed protein product [Didymodactylos carnosus]|uniref:Uncharacterized protein n=1 Tax=Didymodactylos carnosus TaxID=1234261 RepID=A0A814WRZ0_9BILA|nr:unnamed protein product [Didymodactylos carnosus]CAF3969111.1 unnamed protein product [Didymodactylos carnosus]